jgi:hypothetical protein
LKNLQPLSLARAAGLSQEKAEELEQFREELIQRLLTASEPGEQP